MIGRGELERQRKELEAARLGFDREKHRSADLEAKLRCIPYGLWTRLGQLSIIGVIHFLSGSEFETRKKNRVRSKFASF